MYWDRAHAATIKDSLLGRVIVEKARLDLPTFLSRAVCMVIKDSDFVCFGANIGGERDRPLASCGARLRQRRASRSAVLRSVQLPPIYDGWAWAAAARREEDEESGGRPGWSGETGPC